MNDEILERGDFIRAESAQDFPDKSPTSKVKVLDFLNTIYDKDPTVWSSIKTIADESKVSPVYTRNVLDDLCEDKQVEKAFVGKKQYFRLQKD